jgi:hypothetical protein
MNKTPLIKRMKKIILAVGILLALQVTLSAQTGEPTELKLWYASEAPESCTPQEKGKTDWNASDVQNGWEDWSLPLGNGYMGASVFGGAKTERIQITENSFANPIDWGLGTNSSGLNNFVETYVEFGHEGATDYYRDLILNDATAHVKYKYGGVDYEREYFVSYPDKVLVMKFKASGTGNVSFTLKPQTPYIKDYNKREGDGKRKTGMVVASGNTITFGGELVYYGIKYEGQYKVIPQGKGSAISASNVDGKGEITVTGADSATVILAVGTNYVMESRVFMEDNRTQKLAPYPHPHEKVTGILRDASAKTYDELKATHVADYKKYFDRVQLDLGGVMPDVPTDRMLSDYKSGSYNSSKAYLEELYFQYGRYLLICSSREGALPANLQGVWNAYDSAPWGAGYWHNINVQMNYWPSFTTNLIDMFKSYADFNLSFREKAERLADSYVASVNLSAKAADGMNGWCVGTGVTPYEVEGAATSGHSGPGTGGFTSIMFWDYYDFTQDRTVLEEVAYPALLGMSRFLSKSVKNCDGKWLVANSASPEQNGNLRTVGTMFDQQMVYENHLDVLKAADILGYSNDEINLYASQVNRLDHVLVGMSGQVKEYREENCYGEIGDPTHRHISQLVGLHPGTSITSKTNAWMDAAKVTLTKRGDGGTGWSKAHKINLWARAKDGNHAYLMLNNLLTGSTLQNLWDTHAPFQIDGNFGGTSGIAEMLLQSHEGYIEPLAARPDAWTTGCYSGLTARGNFEVGAQWQNGQATEFTLTSKSGSRAGIKYYNISRATVTEKGGASVVFESEGRDLISFETETGKTYVISNIPDCTKVAAPDRLSVSFDGGRVNMKWTGSADAVSYNVYYAEESAPSYKLLGATTSTEFTTKSGFLEPAKQFTFKVVAVDGEGRESDGPTAMILPTDNSGALSVQGLSGLQTETVTTECLGKAKLIFMTAGISSFFKR